MFDVLFPTSDVLCLMSEFSYIMFDLLSNFSSDVCVRFFLSIFFVHFSAVLSVDSPPISSVCLASFFRAGY